MSKEMEFLAQLNDRANQYIIESCQSNWQKMVSELKNNKEANDTIIQALTEIGQLRNQIATPTSSEVCEVLGKHLNREVKLKDGSFFYSEEKQHYGDCDEVICGYGWEDEHTTLAFEMDLPPHIINIVSRFYMGNSK